MRSDWTVWQICDSAFPAGAFAHSGGLEAAWQAGEVESTAELAAWIGASLRQAASGAVPVVAAAWAEPESFEFLDQLSDGFLMNHVANRASRSQGQAFLMACVKSFETETLRRLAAAIRERRLAGHWAPVFGAVTRALEVPRRQVCEVFLFLSLRGAVSGAVRLGIVGPLQGQRLQHELSAGLGKLVDRYIDEPPENVAQTAPLLDLLQGAHDRLYSRLFVS